MLTQDAGKDYFEEKLLLFVEAIQTAARFQFQ